MIGEWSIPFDLELLDLSGNVTNILPLNQTDTAGHRFQLDPALCNVSLPVRTTDDDKPQADGKIPHRRWRSGFDVHLGLELLVDDGSGEMAAACDQDLVEMLDELGLTINEMIRTGLVSGLPNARLKWTPTGFAERMFDRLQLSGTPSLDVVEGNIGPRYEVDFDTPYPYYMLADEEQVAIAATGTEIIVNEGNTDYFPVIKIHGNASLVTITNMNAEDTDGNPLYLVYDSSLPGASSIASPNYVEVVHFTGTAYLNGNQANRKAGIDMTQSTFFPLVPGDNEILVTGADVTVLANSAWA